MPVGSVFLAAAAVSALAVAPIPRARPSPPDPSVLLANAVRLHQAGELDDAVGLYRELLARHPDHVPARSNLGAALVQGGRYRDAIAEYRKALERDEGNVEV